MPANWVTRGKYVCSARCPLLELIATKSVVGPPNEDALSTVPWPKSVYTVRSVSLPASGFSATTDQNPVVVVWL